ncbi:GntR family transcriptional regulator [Corynebacterium poyangense]|uniref:GntR family transcriptional regulator n=2 Tax=Corynebacterium poyangense TaxID=2684405 RepID=A0A7H0SS14_9CORY|nr:GntR family transcriptional regulator [Corynebacterium poyangense]QNQ91339.1 GntR family transcriptional regulator [Corynebacterium poyangense]
MTAIKELIIANHLQPGDPLPTETTLCQHLGVSRSSVREAIRKLEALRIVSVVHGRGTYVGSLSMEPLVQTLAFRAILQGTVDFSALRDVIEVRRYLDLGCAEQVVSSLAGTQQPELAACVSRMRAHAQAGHTFPDDDIAFHLGLMDNIPNEVIKQLIHSLWLVHQAVVPTLGLAISPRLEDTAEAHQAILDAALDGDVAAYREAVTQHYRPLEEIVAEQL